MQEMSILNECNKPKEWIFFGRQQTPQKITYNEIKSYKTGN